MRSTAAVDDLILWLAAGIFGLAWLGVAVVSMDALFVRTEPGSLTKNPVSCSTAHEASCDRTARQ